MQIDYSHYVINSVIDWVEFELSFTNPTNAQYLRRHCPIEWTRCETDELVKPFFNGIAGLPNGTSSRFRFRIQDPKSAAEVQRQLDQFAIDHNRPYASPPIITAVEVALDARSKAQSMDELVNLAEHFQRGRESPKTGHNRLSIWRMYDPAQSKTEFVANIDRHQIRNGLRHLSTLYAGDRGDSATFRVYIKTTDNDANTALPPTDYRARTEITLSGKDCPFANTLAWSLFKFETLANSYFSFVRPAEGLSALSAVLMQHQAKTRIGWGSDPTSLQLQKQKRRKKPSSARADSVLNTRARDALRALTVRQGRSDIEHLGESIAEIRGENGTH